ncbi:hypothetical protein L1267_22140 [Pseudoalteromonas sp. OFAV1]|uniref:hypothetical protein n=1 Tax=Pseudoalteromonas sp. OFAV1 TaxID=2908892 RepID=UPI001F15ED33|nr:hypothetical protein [Pseudoalteromonas sp. OFAV1]MCF2903073.1 hypothetical protein [Pseudoalteromonas sp. OFAV1]
MKIFFLRLPANEANPLSLTPTELSIIANSIEDAVGIAFANYGVEYKYLRSEDIQRGIIDRQYNN